MNETPTPQIDLWGGLECTINRVGNEYFDQLEYSGHYTRKDDVDRIAAIGVKKLRYPVLWERHQPLKDQKPDWSFATNNLNRLRDLGITPIAGLVHHGSGPAYVNFFDGSFEQGLADYAWLVAKEFPWLNYFTPVNEPLTTARFCGLYGLWYPHEKNDYAFARILVSECKGIVMAMQAIRRINPAAKLVQTDDLAKVHSTASLQYQADFENERRWLAFDLVSGNVTPDHPMWAYLTWAGIDESELYFFLNNACKPDIIGLNYYVTSERYLDDNLENYPLHTHGRNHFHAYADVEAVRVSSDVFEGPYPLLREASTRFDQPIAVTEAHLNCHREEQMRWFHEIWQAATQLKEEGKKIEAVTAWALLGSFGWNRLLTEKNGEYEPGVFDVRPGQLRTTGVAKMLARLTTGEQHIHPVLQDHGWWKRNIRVEYRIPVGARELVTQEVFDPVNSSRPLLILGKTGTLGNAFARICKQRNIQYKLVGRDEVDISKPQTIERALKDLNPWAVINTAGYVRVDDAELDMDNCYLANTTGPMYLARSCAIHGVQLVSFSSDLVFDGKKMAAYQEADQVNPLNVYGRSKAIAEKYILESCPDALVIRTSAFFGPWDNYNFLAAASQTFKKGMPFPVAKDVVVSPTYVPDLVHTTLDLLLDGERGIWHLTNEGEITWAEFAMAAFDRFGYDKNLLQTKLLKEMSFAAPRPYYSALKTIKGVKLPSLENALERYFAERGDESSENEVQPSAERSRA